MAVQPTLQKITDRTLLNPLLQNLWMWSQFSPEKNLYFNGYVVKTPEGLVIIDPPNADNDLFDDIRSLGKPVLIYLTNRDHERASDVFRKQFDIPVAIHQLDAASLEIPAEKTMQDGETLYNTLQIIHLPHQKSPGETALYLKPQQALLTGDALIGSNGSLSMLPADKYENIQAAREGLEVLLDIDGHIKAILLCDGDPILENAQSTLVDFFS